jgi:hypothetical protein
MVLSLQIETLMFTCSCHAVRSLQADPTNPRVAASVNPDSANMKYNALYCLLIHSEIDSKV